jgi:hypothetical protein
MPSASESFSSPLTQSGFILSIGVQAFASRVSDLRLSMGTREMTMITVGGRIPLMWFAEYKER